MSQRSATAHQVSRWFLIESCSRWAEAWYFFWNDLARRSNHQRHHDPATAHVQPRLERWQGQPLDRWASGWARQPHPFSSHSPAGTVSSPAVTESCCTTTVWLWALPLSEPAVSHSDSSPSMNEPSWQQAAEAIATVSLLAPSAIQLACLPPSVPPATQLAIQEAGVTAVITELWMLPAVLQRLVPSLPSGTQPSRRP